MDPFGGSVRMRQHSNPLRVASRWNPGEQMPRFWLSAGSDSRDYHALLAFRQLLRRHLPAVPVYLSVGGHTAAAWRAALPPMLEWMTPLLADAPPPGPARPRPGQLPPASSPAQAR